MRSSRKSTVPPPSFDEADAFRSVFLLLVPDERRRDAVQATGRLLGDLLLEAGSAWRSDEPIGAYLFATARDLRHAQYVLALEGENAAQEGKEPEERRLYVVARRMARRIGRLAAELETLFQ